MASDRYHFNLQRGLVEQLSGMYLVRTSYSLRSYSSKVTQLICDLPVWKLLT